MHNRFVLAILMIVLAVPIRASRAQQESSSLTFFEPVQGLINDETPTATWTFEGHADEMISILVTTTSGDLDPTVQLAGPDEEIVSENDDIDSLVRDAGMEAFMLPSEGTYSLEIGRYGETSGGYELTIKPGYGRLMRHDTFDGAESPWLLDGSDQMALVEGRLRLRATRGGGLTQVIPDDATSLDNLYFQTDAQLFGNTTYAEFGILLRAQGATNEVVSSYQFKISTDGKWMFQAVDLTGAFVLQPWTQSSALDTDTWTIGVLARGDTFYLYGNNTLLGTVTDTRLTNAGVFGLTVNTTTEQTDPAAIEFDNIIVTSRLGVTYRGMPVALAQWDATDPTLIQQELTTAGQIQPEPAHDLFVPSIMLSSVDQEMQHDLLGTLQGVYTDFLMGATLNVSTEGQSIGCGLVYRWQDENNLDLAFTDTTGGFGLVQSRDGALTLNVYDMSNAVIPTGPNRLLVIVQGDKVTLYINGTLVAQENEQMGQGRVGVALLNYEDVVTDCFYGDIWVWPLISQEQAE